MIKIISVGNVKDKNLKNLIEDYSDRIRKYQKIELIELKESKNEDIDKETKLILDSISNSDYNVYLDLNGKMLDSIEFKNLISDFNVYSNKKNLCFVIGGSNGIRKDMIKFDFYLCLSKNTFPHQLIKLFLLEQIYRAYKIMNNEIYHK